MKTLLTRIAFITTLTGFNFANAAVYEIQTMPQILPTIDKNTLVVFDIDNTILEPTQTIGSDQWGMNEIAKFKTQGLEERTAKDRGVARFAQVQMRTAVQAVERQTPTLIHYLQKNNIRVLALTARPLNITQRTSQQLQSLGLNLSLTAPPANVTTSLGTEPVIYYQGLLIVGPHNNKGQVLFNFIKNYVTAPISKIVFVDDKAHNVKDVEASLQSVTIPPFEYRYAAADKKVASFNTKIGDIQWQVFVKTGKIINDNQALEILGKN